MSSNQQQADKFLALTDGSPATDYSSDGDGAIILQSGTTISLQNQANDVSRMSDEGVSQTLYKICVTSSTKFGPEDLTPKIISVFQSQRTVIPGNGFTWNVIA